jgi:glycosyltransferase involved in cell wall biosynthesis
MGIQLLERKSLMKEMYISIITPTNRPDFINKVFENYNRQNHKNKELIIILNNNSMIIEDWQEKAAHDYNVRVYQLDEDITLGECRNFAVNMSRYDFVAQFDDDDYYASNYLQSSIELFDQIDADIVGKASTFIYLEQMKCLLNLYPNDENKYVSMVAGATMLMKKSIFQRIKFPNITLGEESEFMNNYCRREGFKIYSGDKYNFVNLRRGLNGGHTYNVADEEQLKFGKVIAVTDDYTKFIAK